MSEPRPRLYEFGPFRLDAQRRLLTRGDAVVKLAPKVFETLLALIEGRDRVLDKAELMRRLWPDSFVEEGNLTLHVSTLRKALGESLNQHRYIVTVPGRGYRFVADVSPVTPEGTVDAPSASPPPSAPAPVAPSPVAAQPVAHLERWLRTAVVGMLVVVLAGASVAWLSRTSSRGRDSDRSAAATTARSLTFTRFTTHGGVPFRVALSRDGRSLVYQQRINGRDTLWLGQTDSNTSVPISQRTDLIYGEPVFAPDGGHIYFTVTGDTHPQTTLVRMPALGGVMTELIPDVLGPVAFSSDGTQLAFVRSDDEVRQTSVALAHAADGRILRTLVTRTWPDAVSPLGVAWAPDGRTLAVGTRIPSGEYEISAISLADGHVTSLGERAWGVIGNLAWLPDGSGVVFLARENAVTRKTQIWLTPFPRGTARQVTADLNLYQRNSLSMSANGTLAVLHGFIQSSIWVAPRGDVKQARRVLQGVVPRYEGVDGLAWTPDRRLLYTAYTGDNLSIWSMDRDGGDLRHLTGSNASTADSQLCATPDGRYIVFQSNRSRTLDIWRANMDGTGLMPLTTGGRNSLPTVSPDGRWVVYTSTRDGQTTLRRVSIDGGESTPVTTPSGSWPQLSPDGTRLASIAAGDTPDARLTIIPFTLSAGPRARDAAVQSFPMPRTALTGRRVLRWMPDGQALIYKDDLRGLWQQRLDEARPHLLRGFDELLHHVAWSFDGKDLAYTTGPTTQEILLITNIH